MVSDWLILNKSNLIKIKYKGEACANITTYTRNVLRIRRQLIKTYNKLMSCVYRRAWPHWVHIKKASGRCSCADNKISKYMDFTALIHPKQYWDNLSSGRRITNWWSKVNHLAWDIQGWSVTPTFWFFSLSINVTQSVGGYRHSVKK